MFFTHSGSTIGSLTVNEIGESLTISGALPGMQNDV